MKPSETGARALCKLSWPIFIELLLQIIVGNADQLMVGLHDPDGVGAIGNANQISNMLILVFAVVCTAATILVSHALGAKDTKAVNQTYAVSLVMNLALGAAVSLLLLFASPLIFTAMGVHAVIFARTCLYMRIIAVGMVFQALYATFSAFFRANQMMKETMAVSVVMNCVNIGGNYLLINGAGPLPALGVAGAAISSDVSRLLGLVLLAALFRRRFGPVLRLSLLRPFPWRRLKDLLAIGVPSAGEQASYNGSQICVQATCNQLATYVVNTRVYVGMFATISYILGSALSQAGQVLVARLMGAGDIPGTEKTVNRILAGALVTAAVLSTAVWAVARPLFSLVTADARVLDLAQAVMAVEIPLELGRAVNMVMSRMLQSCGDIKFPVTICIVSAWVTGVGGGVLFGLVLGWGLMGIWTAMALDECVRAVLFLLRWKSGVWKTKQVLHG